MSALTQSSDPEDQVFESSHQGVESNQIFDLVRLFRRKSKVSEAILFPLSAHSEKFINKMKSQSGNAGSWIGLIIVIALVWWLFFRHPDTWQGFYYPSSGNLTMDIPGPIFSSLDECRDWADSMVQQHNPSGSGYDYECGKNCHLETGLTLQVCDETLR